MRPELGNALTQPFELHEHGAVGVVVQTKRAFVNVVKRRVCLHQQLAERRAIGFARDEAPRLRYDVYA